MFNQFVSRCRPYFIRTLCSPPATGGPSPTGPSAESLSKRFRPNEVQKFLLVWTKKYKSKDEIPSHVSAEIIQKSSSEARIKISNFLILMTILASLGAVITGKAAAKRGESVHQRNLDWHKQYDEEVKRKEASKSSQ